MAGKLLPFVGAYLKTNFATALEYRASLFSQVIGMFVNDILWVLFWVLYFTKFPVLRGWTLEDVIVLWASLATSAGIALGFFSNSARIPLLVVQGQLDYYLSLPKDVLLHLLVSRLGLINLGDLLFGPVLLLVMVELTWAKFAVFVAASLLATAVLLGFFIMTGSLVFFLGNAQTIANQAFNALLHFASYPTPIFDTGAKVILFTVIPAGFVTTIPVELVREFQWDRFLLLCGAAALFLGSSVWVFRAGLRRYESGNLLMMRN